ncbi:MAG: ATP-binding protein [Psychroserpens sp.]|uniref:ATP-binding protein n=1 Tax=Psychroserpens sp. TaxID=2020870 RepID=UPI0030011A65
MNTKKIVITGGPGTGKTSIINELKNNDFYCFDEVIRTMTLSAKKEGDSSTHISNPIAFVNDPMAFNINLINARMDQFTMAKTLKKEMYFFDRGIPDVLAYMAFFNQVYDDFFKNACLNHQYDVVFLLPPWEAIYQSDNERFETFEEALQIHNHLKGIYESFNYQIIEVPFGTVKERTNFILNNI